MRILYKLKESLILVNKEILVKAIIADYNYKKALSTQNIWLNKIITNLILKYPLKMKSDILLQTKTNKSTKILGNIQIKKARISNFQSLKMFNHKIGNKKMGY
jgi:hypothetical protein